MDVNNLCMKCMNESMVNGICRDCGAGTDLVQEPAFALPVHTILNGKYLVGAVIGHGGFGITYIAFDMERNKKVAIKEYMPEGIAIRLPGTTMMSVYSGENTRNYSYGMNKFLEEARTIYNYRNNGNIVNVFELFEENSTAYYVMQYLNGMDLKRYVQTKGGKIEYTEALKILRPVCDALKEMHNNSLIHRDISPDNIFIEKDGRIKLLDFGAARIALRDRSQNFSVILKLKYAPVEQYRENGKQGPWTDIYAVGGTFYQMITGELPPQSTDRDYEDTIIPPSKLCKELPDNINYAILKALAVRAENRFQNIAEFENALMEKGPIKQVDLSIRKPESTKYQAVEPVYAGFWLRVGAAFLDSIIFSVITRIISTTYTLYDASFVVTILGVMYYSLMESSQYQATLGKMACGLVVTDTNGNRLTIKRAVGRYFGKWVSVLTLGIGFIMAGTTAKKQALHDLMAGTYVIKRTTSERLRKIQYKKPSSNFLNQMETRNSEILQRKKPSIKAISGYYENTVFPIDTGSIIMGRDAKSCQIIFPSDTPGVSAMHCKLIYDAPRNSITLMDIGSSYGTYLLNGRKLKMNESVGLNPGEGFVIGSNNKFIFL